MNLVPVDSDPFAAPSPTLVPVDHDPFASPDAQQTPDPGFAANAARALRMGLPFGNQFVAGERTIAGMLPGGYPTQSYGQNLADVNAADARLQQEHPVIADLGQGTGAAVGALAVPAAALGEGAQGLGLLGRATRGGIAGAALGSVQGAGSPGSDIRDLPQTEEGAVGGLYAGGALGAGFPVAGAGIGKGYSALADALRGGPGPADIEGLKTATNAAYQHVKDLGAAYSPQSFKNLTDKIASDAAEADIDPDLNPKATKVIANLQARADAAVKSGTPVSLPQLDKARQFVNDNLSGLPEPKQARFGAMIRSNIDDFVNTAFPGDMVPMQAKAAAESPEKIVSAAVKAPNGDVFTAPNDPLALDKAEGAGHDIWDMVLGKADDQGVRTPPPDSGGFVTSSGRYVSRDEASQMTGIKGNQLTGTLENSGQARPQVPPGPAPTPMLDFLRRAGGVKDEGGDLASMGFSNLNGVAAKGSSKIIDKENGLPMDEARRMAAEAGYMEPHETVSDFINKLVEHPTYSQQDEEAVAARAARYVEPEAELGNNPAGIAPEDYSGLGEAPPMASRQPVISPAAVPSGPVASAQEAADAINAARGLAQRQFKANALAKALSKSEINAHVSGTGGNIENATRRSLASILEKEPWTPDEADQINRMIHGTTLTNTLRQFSRLGPKGNALMMALELGSGSPTLARMGAVGMGAQGAEALTRRAGQDKMLATILAGGKAPAQAATPRLSRAAMAAALASNADLQAQRNQATPQ